MQFEEAVQYLLGLGHETLTIKLGLRNTELLLEQLGNPEHSFPSVQIAGTNGKGSTAAFLESICRAAEIRTGLYTSPHLVSITERIKVAGLDLSEDAFARHTAMVKQASLDLVANGQLPGLPTFFEQVTAIALIAFREAGVELAILETGLGGRLDSTTAAAAKLCAITQVALDHEEYLGNTIESIASEKAAIIRPGSRVVVAKQSPEAMKVILTRCDEVGVKSVVHDYEYEVEEVFDDGRFQVTIETKSGVYENVTLGLRGSHQIENAATAIQLAEALREDFNVAPAAIVSGLETAVHQGRLEWIAGPPVFVLDGAHNPAGAEVLKIFLERFALRPLTIVFGAMVDKKIEEITEKLLPLADNVVVTEVQNPRSAKSDSLASAAGHFAKGDIHKAATSKEALEIATRLNNGAGMICITGSLYLIGEVRPLLIGKHDG